MTLFVDTQFSTVATSDYNKIAYNNHTVEASALFPQSLTSFE